MKKNFYSLLMTLLLSVLVVDVFAADVFYVDPETRDSSDDNPGTSESPWRTLNETKWTDGCTVIIESSVYISKEILLLNKSVTLEGASGDIFIAAVDDDEFADGVDVDYRFFSVGDEDNAATLTIKKLTLKNIIRDLSVEDSNPDGGMIFVSMLGTLNMENVVVENSQLINDNGFGGAIHSQGTINAANCTFTNCLGVLGGAIYIKNTEEPVVGHFTKCTFSNNTAGLASGDSEGGAVAIANAKRADILFDQCYFESNQSVRARAGAIGIWIVDQCDVKFIVKNTTLANNFSEAWGGAVAINSKPIPTAGKLDIEFINNVFYKNEAWHEHGVAISLLEFESMSEDVTGCFALVNNTFLYNKKPAGNYTSVFMRGHAGLDLVMMNNISMDGVYGINIEESGTAFKSHVVTNNIFDAAGGTDLGGTGYIYLLRHAPDNTNVDINEHLVEGWTEEQRLAFVGIQDMLTTAPKSKVAPALAIANSDGLAVDFGRNSYEYNGKNIVPQTDIFGQAIVGVKDAGSYEMQGGTGLENTKADVITNFAFFDKDRNCILLSEQMSLVEVYDIFGICIVKVENVSSIHVPLASGIYVVKVKDVKGGIRTQKLVK